MYKNWANLEKKSRKDKRKPVRVLKISSRKYVKSGRFLALKYPGAKRRHNRCACYPCVTQLCFGVRFYLEVNENPVNRTER
jgi:hypothetical protein